MPSVHSLVADIVSGTVIGIGAKPSGDDFNSNSTLSDTCRVKHNFVHTKIGFGGGNRVSFHSAETDINFDGSYVHFSADWNFVGNMDQNRPIAVSGNFSGCMWKVYHIEGSTFKAVHIPRAGGKESEAFVKLCETYAKQSKWTEIRSVGSNSQAMGGALNHGEEILMISQLFLNARLETVRIKVDSQGLIIQKDNWTDLLG
jgi:hypothetical protein